MKIADYLPTGKQNAIPSKLPARTLNFKSVRILQKAVERERKVSPILTDSGGGYYLPANEREVIEFCKTLEHRARNTVRTMENVKSAYLAGRGC